MTVSSRISELRDLRGEIARIDRAIMVLVAARLRTAHQAIELRVASGEEVTNGGQELVVLDRARKWAEEFSVSPDFSERLFRALIHAGKIWTEPPNRNASDLPSRVVGRLARPPSSVGHRPLVGTSHPPTLSNSRAAESEIASPKS